MKHPSRHSRCLFLIVAVIWLAGCSVKVTTPAVSSDPLSHLRTDLERIFADPIFATAQWGVEVLSLDRGDLLFEHNATRLYMPASNNKILAVAAALMRLGPDYHYETRVSADGAVVDGVLQGNLVVTGSGDPSMAARFHDGDSFRVFRDWAAKLKEKGIRKIEGAIVGDARAFPQPLLGQSWELDDLVYGYAAPVSALQFNENLYAIEVTPGSIEGAPAEVKCKPFPDYVTLDAKVTTVAAGAKGDVEIRRGARDESLIVRGSIPAKADPDITTVAVVHPTLYYISALRKTLQEEGIDVTSATIREVTDAEPLTVNPGQLLWVHSSPSLAEILKPLLKVSQNLYAETLVRTLGLVLRKQGSFEAGKAVVMDALQSMAIPSSSYAYFDGSGLSRQNLLSADLLIRIFRSMYRNQYFNVFYEGLAIAGVDGTISGRMKGTKAQNNVHGKTGTAAYVRCLSGYIKTADGEMLGFAMIANNFLAPNAAVEYVQDSALECLANFHREK